MASMECMPAMLRTAPRQRFSIPDRLSRTRLDVPWSLTIAVIILAGVVLAALALRPGRRRPHTWGATGPGRTRSMPESPNAPAARADGRTHPAGNGHRPPVAPNGGPV